MFFGDIRSIPKVSLNVNLIRTMLEESYEDREITNKFAMIITRNCERYLAIRLNLAKSVSVLEAFHNACDNYFS